MKTEQEIEEQLGKARKKMEELSGSEPAYKHASSVDDALAWVLGWAEELPMEDED